MKIAHLISNISYGGAERQLLLLCRALKKSGEDVIVGSMKSGGELVDEFRSNGIVVTEFGMRGPVDPFAFFKVRRWLQQEAPDLLHTHLFKADVYGGFATELPGPPVFCTKYNQDQYLKNRFFGWLGRKSARRCVKIIALSNAVRTYLIEVAGFDSNKIEVIPLGIEIQETLPERKELGTRFGVVARLAEQKGHSTLLRAFRIARDKRSDLKLFIYGSGPLEGELRDLTRRLNLNDAVSFEGFVRQPDNIYTNVDALILPSLWEGAGLVLLESISRGIPVIASNVGGIPELVRDGCGRLVPPADENALARAILELAEDPTLRAEFSVKCREQSLLFDSEKLLRSHLRLYQSLAKGQ